MIEKSMHGVPRSQEQIDRETPVPASRHTPAVVQVL